MNRREFLKTSGGLLFSAVLAPKDLMPVIEKLASEPKPFEIYGIPQKITGKNLTVDVANKDFGGNYTNFIGKGTEGWLAEPGVLLVGPDYKGSMHHSLEYLSPINQQVFEQEPPSFFNVPEGGFMLTTGAEMAVNLRGKQVKLIGRENHNWMFITRGLFSDNKQGTDRNVTARFSRYIPGHIQAMRYPSGAFISEEYFKQIAEKSHLNGTNCGEDGCAGLSVAMLDLNTEAFSVIYQQQLNDPWVQLFSNWGK